MPNRLWAFVPRGQRTTLREQREAAHTRVGLVVERRARERLQVGWQLTERMRLVQANQHSSGAARVVLELVVEQAHHPSRRVLHRPGPARDLPQRLSQLTEIVAVEGLEARRARTYGPVRL